MSTAALHPRVRLCSHRYRHWPRIRIHDRAHHGVDDVSWEHLLQSRPLHRRSQTLPKSRSVPALPVGNRQSWGAAEVVECSLAVQGSRPPNRRPLEHSMPDHRSSSRDRPRRHSRTVARALAQPPVIRHPCGRKRPRVGPLHGSDFDRPGILVSVGPMIHRLVAATLPLRAQTRSDPGGVEGCLEV